jgi:hypothetical protein
MNGVKWVAVTSPSRFNADGSFYGRGEKNDEDRGGSATLGFNPVDGVVYTLDASLRGIASEKYYVAVGFAHGQSNKGNRSCRFLKGFVTGRAWLLLYGPGHAGGSRAVLGTTGSSGGTADGEPLRGFEDGLPADIDLRIVLDTSGGPGKWTATWLAKEPSQEGYGTLRPTAPVLNESINSVGFAVGGDGISGKIEGFSLRASRKEAAQPGLRVQKEPARVARKEGAVSFWFRTEPAARKRQEIFWSAGESVLDDSIHARLNADGTVGLFMENGRYDVLITSDVSVDEGRWHHCVASWSPSAVDLYLDGRRVASDIEFREKQQGILDELRFGGGPAGSKIAPFTGWIDEIALWDRALTHAEATHQYQSAKGSGGK